MYIIAIAWLYVTILMAATEATVTAGILTLVFYGLLPCALLLWLLGTPQRRRTRQARAINEANQHSVNDLLEDKFGQPNGSNTKPD